MLEVAICDDDKEDLDKAALILDKILSEFIEIFLFFSFCHFFADDLIDFLCL